MTPRSKLKEKIKLIKCGYLLDIDDISHLELDIVAVVIRVFSGASRWVCELAVPVLFGKINDFQQILNPLLRIVGNLVHLGLVNHLLLVLHVLPVDDAIAEDLLAALTVGEAGVFSRERGHHVEQIIALRHLSSKHPAVIR